MDAANECEQYWIEKLESYKNGYNMTTGGDGYCKYGDITDNQLVDHAIQYCIDNNYQWYCEHWVKYCRKNNLPIDYAGRFNGKSYFGFREAITDKLIELNLKEPGYKLVSTMHTSEQVIDHAVKCFIENNQEWTRPLWKQYSKKFNIQQKYYKNGKLAGIVKFYEDLTDELVARGIREPGYKVSITMHTEENMIEHGIKFFIENGYFWASDKWRIYQKRFNMPILTPKYYNGGYQEFKKIMLNELINRKIVSEKYKIDKLDHLEQDILSYAEEQYKEDGWFDRLKWRDFCLTNNIPVCYYGTKLSNGALTIKEIYANFESKLYDIVSAQKLPTILGELIVKNPSEKYWFHNDELEECHLMHYNDPRLKEPGWEFNKKIYARKKIKFFNPDTQDVIKLKSPDEIVNYHGNWIRGSRSVLKKYLKKYGKNILIC